MNIKAWLHKATEKLVQSGIDSARLDALILLEDAIGKDRSWILAHDDYDLGADQVSTLEGQISQRANRMPLAYIRGYIEFYGRRFGVTHDTLIPRPETEDLIELALTLPLPRNSHIIDIGTGSGCIAITLKAERPEWTVVATDISSSALSIAKNNAQRLLTDINIINHDLLSPPIPHLQPLKPDLITANLPYVAKDNIISPEAYSEPAQALFAGSDGYELIERLLPQAANHLASTGFLILESDPWQQERIISQALQYGLLVRAKKRFHLVLQFKHRAHAG